MSSPHILAFLTMRISRVVGYWLLGTLDFTHHGLGDRSAGIRSASALDSSDDPDSQSFATPFCCKWSSCNDIVNSSSQSLVRFPFTALVEERNHVCGPLFFPPFGQRLERHVPVPNSWAIQTSLDQTDAVPRESAQVLKDIAEATVRFITWSHTHFATRSEAPGTISSRS